MATISEESAMDLIARDGYYPGDPRISKVVRYTNHWGKTCYAIVYPFEHQMRYEQSPACYDVEVIWTAS
jgi:hypothetical protein